MPDCNILRHCTGEKVPKDCIFSSSSVVDQDGVSETFYSFTVVLPSEFRHSGWKVHVYLLHSTFKKKFNQNTYYLSQSSFISDILYPWKDGGNVPLLIRQFDGERESDFARSEALTYMAGMAWQRASKSISGNWTYARLSKRGEREREERGGQEMR